MNNKGSKIFTAEKITERIFRIKDPLNVYMYLVIGEKRCCLIDTGWGFKGLKQYVYSLCNLPVVVILTHGHPDHASGATEFEEVYMNSEEKRVYDFYSNPTLKNFIVGFDVISKYDLQPVRGQDFLELHDHDVFDIGRISIEMISVPGHTKGLMMALIREERAILFGDGCGPGTLLIEDFASTIETYYESLNSLKKREDEYDIILRNHGTGFSEKELLDNVMEICKEILNEKDDKILMQGGVYDALTNHTDYHIYSAKKLITIDGATVRIDGKEGNITYRDDKVIKKSRL